MSTRKESEFATQMRVMIERICERDGISRVNLAEDLGISKETIFRAVYEAKIGFDLILRICRKAKATPEELWDIELAWMRTKEERPREQVFDNAMAVVRTLMKEVDSMEAFMKKHDLLDEYMDHRKGKVHPLIARSKRHLRGR